MEGIQISVDRAAANPEISIVRIAGYIDTTTSSELERVIQNLLREQRYKIIVDLSEVDYISSAGWGIFISEIKNLRLHKGDLKLACMSQAVNEVYELLEFATILTATVSVDDAIAQFNQDGSGGAAGAPAVPPPRPAPLKDGTGLGQRSGPPRPGGSEVRSSTPPPAAAPSRSAPGALGTARPNPPRPAAPPPAAPPPVAKPAAAPEPDPAAWTSRGDTEPLVPLIDRIRALVKLHPDWNAWRLKKELNQRRGHFPKVSWGEVRAELKYSGLKSKAERFRFARGG